VDERGNTLRSRITAVWLLALVTGVACLAWTASASAGPAPGLQLPAIKGPLISSLPAVAAVSNTPCIFETLGLAACRSPYELQQAYDFPAGLDGSGQTITIYDAYGSPTIAPDLESFDAYYGIPDPPSFTVDVAPAAPGSTGGSGDTADWGVETSLDVEYAHAMAPGAKIVLVVAASDNNDDLNAAEAYGFPRYPGAIVSQSFGDWETDSTAGNSFQVQHRLFVEATALGDTLIASTGDAGATWTQYTGTTTPALAAYPASDPLVTSIGGTEGNPYPEGLYNPVTSGYGGEQVWNESDFDAAGGGAPSILFSTPLYQLGLTQYHTRTIPDVSYNASILGGVAVFDSPNIYLVGGTSAGSPMWASIIALTDQARQQAHKSRLGYANAALYAIGRNPFQARNDFHDITVGNNALDSTVGFNATRGYDLATGFGTPNVANLVRDLVSSPFGGNPLFALPVLFTGNGSTHGHGHPHVAHTMIPG
jgi:subtilase family serine protease